MIKIHKSKQLHVFYLRSELIFLIASDIHVYKVHTCLDYCIDLFAKLISKLSITIKAVVINFNANKPIIIDSTITVVYLIEVGKQGCIVGDDR